jgi:serine/threonine protein phosphatase PrpC
VVWNSVAKTDVGMVREINEDSILSLPEAGFWAVADGMGGYEAGDVASSMVLDSLSDLTRCESLNDAVDAIEDCLLDVNGKILEYGDIMLDGRTLGSTVVSLLIQGRVGVCLWAGDSRLYRLRNRQLIQLSRDHSQVEEHVQQGYLSPDQAESHPDSNVITRAIGAEAELYVDINVFSTQLGDVFLLCSDGLYNMVNSEEMAEVLLAHPLTDAVQILVDLALQRGADDNVSVILVKGEQKPAPKQQATSDVTGDE